MINCLKKAITKVIKRTTIKNTKKTLIQKLNEETLELSLAIRDHDVQNAKEEIADVLIVLVQIMEMFDFQENDLKAKLFDVETRYKKYKGE